MFYSSCLPSDPIHYLKPPKLEVENIERKVLCNRPMRLDKPNMDIEAFENKIIVNNYGHGGSGWTLAPGCAEYVVEKFNKKMIDRNESIVVIGAGVLGLFTVYELVKKRIY